MRKPIHRLKEELRAETCPPHVLANVRERIAKERQPARQNLVARNIAFAGGIVLLLIVGITRWFTAVSPVHELVVAQAEPLTAIQVANETHLSLACFGSTIVEAGNRTETIILNHVKPRLLDSLDRASKAIANQLPL